MWPPDRPKIADHEIVAARDHVASCRACRAHFEIDRLLAGAREGLLRTTPSREIRERLFDSIAELRAGRGEGTRVRQSRRWPAIVVAFASLGAVVLIVVFGLSRLSAPNPAERQLDSAFVDDYRRLAVREDHIVTSDSAEVRRFLLRELGTSISPIAAAGFRIVGAEVCLLEGQRGAMIRYETPTGTVSYYLLPESGAKDRAPAVVTAPAPDGTALVTWVSGSVRRALVGPLAPADLLEVARASGL